MNSINFKQQQQQQVQQVEACEPAPEDGALWNAAAAAGNTVQGFGEEVAGLGHLAAAGGLVAAAVFSWFGEGTQRQEHDTSTKLHGAANEQMAASAESQRSAWSAYDSAAKHVGRIGRGFREFLFGR